MTLRGQTAPCWGLFGEKLLRFVLLLGFLLASQLGLAQYEPTPTVKHTGDYDTNYVGSYQHLLSLKTYAILKYTHQQLNHRPSSSNVTYLPNISYGIGLGFTYKMAGLDVSVEPTFLSQDDRYYGQTNRLDFQGSLYLNIGTLSADLQIYRGYYQNERSKVFPGPTPSSPLPQRRDFVTIFLEIQALYAFNKERFSLRAVQMMDRIQLKSQGSIMLAPFFTMNSAQADSNLIPPNLRGKFNENLQLTDYQILSLGVSSGYAYTFVYKKHFYLSLSLLPGVALSGGTLKTEDPEFRTFSYIRPALRIQSINSIGYNGDRFFCGMQLTSERLYFFIPENQHLRYGLGKFKTFIGYRFNVKKKKD